MTIRTNRPTRIDRFILFFLFTSFTCAVFFTGIEGRLFFFSQLTLWLFFLMILVRSAGRFSLPLSVFSISLAFFLFYSALTLIWSPVPAYSQAILWRHGSILLIFYALLLSEDGRHWSAIRSFVSLVALITASAAVIQYLTGQQPAASFLNKNSLAGFLMPLLFWALLKSESKGVNRLSGMLLFCGTLVLGLIGSRGAYLATIAGAGLIVILLRHCRIELASWRYSLVFSGSGLITSLLITGLDLGRGLGRLGTLQNPWSAGADRFLIWQSSWEMFRDAPWYGLGVGIYGLAYPDYRHFDDKSAGHFAHNDLLQIGIETGIPGALSAVLICVFFADLVRRGLKNTTLSQRDKSEIIILAGGLLAVFFHSMFTFNLYIYSTLLVIGIVIARFYFLLPPSVGKVIRVDLNKFGKILRYAPPLACLIPLLFLFSGLWSQINTQQAFSALKHDRNEQAVRYLENAKRLWPSNDFNWYMEGEIVRLGLQNDRQLSQEQRADLFPLAKESFEEAIRLNPLRAMSPHKLGLLLDNENNKVGKQSLEKIMELYRQALQIDPRYFPARVDLARLYAKLDRNDRAEELLEAGLPYYYHDIPDMIPYLQLAGHYRNQKGDTKGFDMLQQRIEDIKKNWRDKG